MVNCYTCKDKIVPARAAKFLVPPWDERDRSTPQSPVPFCGECYAASEKEAQGEQEMARLGESGRD